MEKLQIYSQKSLYWLLLILSLKIGFIIYSSLKEQFGLHLLVFFSVLSFLLFVTGLLGLLWSRLKPVEQDLYVGHVLLIGVLFIILFFIHIWMVLPRICPDFSTCLGI